MVDMAADDAIDTARRRFLARFGLGSRLGSGIVQIGPNTLAAIEERLGKVPQAAASYEKVLKLDPAAAEAGDWHDVQAALALLNRLGLAKDTFLIDALPTIAKQYYAVAGARVHLRGEPHPDPQPGETLCRA